MQPGRALPHPVMGCDCCVPLVARDPIWGRAAVSPPGAASADLSRLLARFDAEFDCRTVSLSYLMLATPFSVCGYWRRRFTEN